MALFRLLVTLGCVITLAGCSPITVSTDYDPSIDFSDYRTYAWLPDLDKRIADPQSVDPRINNTLLDKRVRKAVETHLGAKGYTMVSTDTPDLYVAYHAALIGKVDVTTVNRHYGYGPGWRGRGGSIGTETHVREYEEGTLILDLIDAKTESLIWRGLAQAEVWVTSTPEEREKRINEAVRKMLERFPPK